MATSIVPIVYPPLPTFSGRKKEDVVEFIEAVDCFFQLKKGLYDEESVPGARRSLLAVCCRGKATLFIKHLHPARKDTWEHLTAVLIEEYALNTTADRERAVLKAMKLRQKSDEELKSYARRAKKLAKKVDHPTLEQAVTTSFVYGIRDKNIRTIVAASLGKADFTFNGVYQAVKAVARASRKYDSDSDSDTSSDSWEDGIGARKHHHHHARKEMKSKVTETEVKTTKPAPDEINMDGLVNLIEEAPQAPFIESYAVSELADEKKKAVENEEKEKAVENEEKEKDGAAASSGNGVKLKEASSELVNVVQKDKDDMRMQGDDCEEKQRKVKETECAEVLLMMEKEERDILDKERAGKDGKEKQEEDVRMQEDEKVDEPTQQAKRSKYKLGEAGEAFVNEQFDEGPLSTPHLQVMWKEGECHKPPGASSNCQPAGQHGSISFSGPLLPRPCL
jgi:hypothetical protein